MGVGAAMQEENARVAVGVLSAQLEAFRSLSRLQHEALASLAGGAFDAAHGPVPGRGPSGGDSPGLPIEDYGRLDTGELESRLKGLSLGEVHKLRAHERRTRNRRPMMECMDRALV